MCDEPGSLFDNPITFIPYTTHRPTITRATATATNFTVRSGEIVGIAGVAGNGQGELLAALNGEASLRDASRDANSRADCIKIDGKACGLDGVNARRKLGLASIPEERLDCGAVAEMSLLENGLLTSFQRFGFVRQGLFRHGFMLHGFIRYRNCRRFVVGVVARFQVKSHGIGALATSLSGGNLQKFIVGREICQNPRLLVVSQPTWGVDAGAAQAIRIALREMANRRGNRGDLARFG